MLRIGVDIGGTFTDFCGWREGEQDITSLKVPSTPPDFENGFKQGFERLLERLRPEDGESALVMHGTTVSTNAVIERKGPKIAFFVTKGYRDLLELQRMGVRNPLNIFENRTKPLVDRAMVFEVEERLLRGGTVETAIDEEAVEALARQAMEAGAAGFAVALLHSYANPHHETIVERAIRRVVGKDAEVSLSSEIWPRIGEYERATISVLNAFVRRRMNTYIGAVESYVAARLPGSQLFVTRSNGGAMAAAEARAFPVHTLLSGPASGVTAVQYLGRAIGEHNILTMDMGGTSTDISLVRDGEALTSTAAEVGDFPVVMPVTGIEAIGAGGGSIAALDGGVLRIGPQSAGSFPGPACFGRGGTAPTLTDAYLLAGYLPEALLGGAMHLNFNAAEKAMASIAEALGTDVATAAEMCVTVASSNMVAGVLPYLARQGVDPEELTLLVYGGAGAIQGPLLAAEIGVNRVLVPSTPSVFCALGGLVSELSNDTMETVHGRDVDGALIARTFAALKEQAADWLARQASPDRLVSQTFECWAAMRYVGQSFQIDVRLPDSAVEAEDLKAMQDAFHQEHERIYSHADPGAAVEFVDLRMRVRGAMSIPEPASPGTVTTGAPVKGVRPMRFQGHVYPEVRIYDRANLGLNEAVHGPAVIEQPEATIVVPPDFIARTGAYGVMVMSRS
ncbi:hydantoinase/oxoprolinase family protein [Chelatococcus asaccharovorans]|uniref:hydantoinase/oxoprolinase family protein n=1 Tax=Chelatococcus asaccharovorans TaxID=28210 RepID=UPI00224C784F|nr:hydantoinase/oxoprolinase family protein [Chelatococcus asaccharovorans]CAH1656966.1 N-methylhydantoinase A [Chelatococcus asaccharovorans]CAH1684931.1 N-methylhydantoinase A [Chelatococcus asaccharovorans]